MRFHFILSILVAAILVSCISTPEHPAISDLVLDSPQIEGKPEYLPSPYVTAGNRVYMVGHQDGSFPELGWHIKGEMGGIWNHPIKLMDGFTINLNWDNYSFSLDKAKKFTNYPMANVHHYSIAEKALEVKRWQFVPDDEEGVFVQVEIENTGTEKQRFFIDFIGNTDLRPTWLGERTDMMDAQDEAEFNEDIAGWVVRDEDNPWFVCFGSSLEPTRTTEIKNTFTGMGTSNAMQYPIELAPNTTEVINFIISGSYVSEQETIDTFKKMKMEWPTLFETKKERYQALAELSKLTIPDKEMQQTFEWLKYNCDWLVRTVPELGTGIGAGIPDYPWYFGVDSEYALMGYMAIGQEDVVYKTIQLLDSVSNAVNDNGKIIHEMSTNGAVFNPGNINETPQYASLIWQVYKWNGDKEFLRRYFSTITKGLEWLVKENDSDGNGFPEGFGMMEIHGLDSEMIDVAAYSQKGFADAAKIADALGDSALANAYEAVAANLKEKINTEFWSEDFNSYADFIGTDVQALHLIEDAIVRADTLDKPWAIKELEATRHFIKNNPSATPRPFVMHHNWVVNTPMEVGIADTTKAIKALETAKDYVNPFGMFVTGIDRDASAGSNDGAYKAPPIFTYTGAVMTLPTGVQARAENNYGRPNEALDYLERMTRSFSYALPGSMYEVSPDFGMMVQAWNIYSFAYPVVHQFFGIQPNAAEKEIVMVPQMPDKWHEASLENVKVGDNTFSIYYGKGNKSLSIRTKQTNWDWSFKVILPTSFKNAGLVVTQGKDISVDKKNFIISAENGEIDATIYFEESK